MQPIDEKRFVRLLQGLAATFTIELDEAAFEGYRMALSDIPIGLIERAVVRATQECERMPTGKVLRELSGELSDRKRAVLAWGIFLKTIRSEGAYRSVDFDDAVINATVRNLGGWERVCSTPEGDETQKWLRRDFERVYIELCHAEVNVEMARPLIGTLDRDNAARGYNSEVKVPLRIECGLPPHKPGVLQLAPSTNPEMKRLIPTAFLKGVDNSSQPQSNDRLSSSSDDGRPANED